MSRSFPSKRQAGLEHFAGSSSQKAGGRVTSRPPKLTLLAAYANIQPYS
jgi:hypothetical protein